ncbi:hypothetical protein [Caulobacter sp.]|uniref:hypothetical protein n=1 Tax=Caulobacter sp. TaxID=78 RepID=UPI003BAF688A
MSAPTIKIRNPDLMALATTLAAGLAMAEQSARGTGRTTRMLAQVQPGDRIVAPTDNIAHFLRREVERRLPGGQVRIDIADPRHSVFAVGQRTMGCGSRPTLPDHTWVEMRLKALIEDAVRTVQFELDQIDEPRLDATVRPHPSSQWRPEGYR